MSASTNGRRPPPAFQMYSSDRLADRQFKLMTLAERGLLHTLELELWVNRTVPRDTAAMARILGLDAAEVGAALTERVLARFTQDGDNLISPELEAYREQLEDHHRRKSEGGKKGMANRWGKGSAGNSPDNSLNNSLNNSLSREEMSRVEKKGVHKEEALPDEEQDAFVRDLEGDPEFITEAARRYAGRRG